MAAEYSLFCSQSQLFSLLQIKQNKVQLPRNSFECKNKYFLRCFFSLSVYASIQRDHFGKRHCDVVSISFILIDDMSECEGRVTQTKRRAERRIFSWFKLCTSVTGLKEREVFFFVPLKRFYLCTFETTVQLQK